MADGATNGQQLYEYKNPSHFPVRHLRDTFNTGEVMYMPNPQAVPWKYLTERCRQSWETLAIGHYLFSGKER